MEMLNRSAAGRVGYTCVRNHPPGQQALPLRRWRLLQPIAGCQTRQRALKDNETDAGAEQSAAIQLSTAGTAGHAEHNGAGTCCSANINTSSSSSSNSNRLHVPYPAAEVAAVQLEGGIGIAEAGEAAAEASGEVAAASPSASAGAGDGGSSAPAAVAAVGELSLVAGIKKIGSLALPLALQFVAGYGLTITGAVFIGRLGPEPLSVSVLASSIYNVAGLSVALGLSSGMETLCGQAFGARNYSALGLVLQRALLVCWVACIPIGLALLNAGPLLHHAGQQPAIASAAADYLKLLVPCLFMSTAQECMRKYLLAQQVVRPTMVATAIVTALAPAYYWLLVCKLGMGLTGAAYAYCCCHLTGLALLGGYVAFRSQHMRGSPLNTWGGFSTQAFSGWGEYLSYGVPTAIMICMEWWAYEVLILLAGALPSAQVSLAVMGICLNISTWVYMLPMALGSAVNTWVSNCLGAGDAAAARSMFRSGMVIVVGLQAAIAGSLVLGGAQVAQIFCADPAVVAVATKTLPLVGALCFADGLNSVLGAVLRASGRQAWGAAVNLVGYWAIGVPLGAWLGFSSGLGVVGFWLGVGTSAVLQALALGLLVSRWDWQGEVVRAQRRLAGGKAAAAGGH